MYLNLAENYMGFDSKVWPSNVSIKKRKIPSNSTKVLRDLMTGSKAVDPVT